MPAKIMVPEFRVMLYKTMARRMVTGSDGRKVPASERFSGGSRVIDITPFFGDGSSLETSKSVRQPAGQWAMVVVDQMEADKRDSLYLLKQMEVMVTEGFLSAKNLADLLVTETPEALLAQIHVRT